MDKNELKEKILLLLQTYPTREAQIALLKFELGNMTMATPEEMLQAMAYSRGTPEYRPSAGNTSDKTYRVAVTYQDQAERQNRDQYAEVALELERLERKQYRLRYCVSQLPTEQASVVTGMYFEHQDQRSLGDKLHLSESTIKRYRNRALDTLTEMYLTLLDAGAVLDW